MTFADPDLCAVRGSSVVLRCLYDYPDGHTVRTVTWSKGVSTNGQWTRVELSFLPALENRSDYLGDLQHDCRLALSELEESDSGYYYFRFDTDRLGWRSRSSVYLTVTGIYIFQERNLPFFCLPGNAFKHFPSFNLHDRCPQV